MGRVDHDPPCYGAKITSDADDDPEYSFLSELPKGVIAAEDDQPDNVLLEYDDADDDVEGVEEALELHYDADSDDDAAAEQQGNQERAPTEPTDTTESTEPPTKFDQPATQHLRRSPRKRS